MGRSDEVSVGLVSTCARFGSLDETVEPLQQPDGDHAVKPIEDAFPTTLDGLCGPDDGFQTAMRRPERPALQEGFPDLAVGLFKEFFEDQADLIRSGCLEVVGRQGLQLSTLLIGQIVGVLEPQVARFLQHTSVVLASSRRTWSTAWLPIFMI